ncbi:MBL fold metallo-hydrolase [Mammaliicoccus sciuri]|uniref:MBL fold metallo-hydrolase n=1 Tax=Mammaliicoccus sciuri TaxID=1296 RepID=UPI002B25FECD|nr:MBL fold metallo-hydrolase [Mammaliicoccus sciuri]WQJ66639.1 MBL fold metallo-hydrolase [Mammaliicoccus sciuri]
MKYEKVQKALQYRTRDIAGCLITHEHGDHAKYTNQYLKNGINCYMTKGTKEATEIQSHRLYSVKAKQETRIGTWSILPFEIEHDAAEPVGFLLKSTQGYKVLYLTDTKFCKYSFKGLTHLMLEVNYIYEKMQENVQKGFVHQGLANRIMDSHFSLEYALKLLKVNDLTQLQQIHLIHLSNTNSDAQLIKQQVQEASGVPVYIGGL